MKDIPKIINIEKLEEGSKKGYWEVKLYSEITIYLETHVLFRQLLKQYCPHQTHSFRNFIKHLVYIGYSEENILSKLNYFLMGFSKLPGTSFCIPNYKSHMIFIQSSHDFELITKIDLDSNKDDSVKIMYECLTESSPWMDIDYKNLKYIIE